MCAVFSKNLHLYENPLKVEGKPDNMIFIASSPMVNEIMEVPEDCKWFVDHVFTVYDEDYAKEHGININCGTWDVNSLDHRCKRCLRCYELDNEAVRYVSPKGAELRNAWFFSDYRKFIPEAYLPKYLNFKLFPLRYSIKNAK